MTCGIYILKFIGTSQVYIGQSRNIEKRYQQHLGLLRSGYASNKLHKAYLKYGIPILEIVQVGLEVDLDRLEYEYILSYDSVINGFNTRSTPTSGGVNMWGDQNGRSKYSNEQIIEVFYLLLEDKVVTYPEICKITGVPKATITDIANGTGHTWLAKAFPDEYKSLLSIKGKRNTRFYRAIMSPLGTVYEVTHLSSFCSEHGLDTGNISKLLRGKKKSYNGWTAVQE